MKTYLKYMLFAVALVMASCSDDDTEFIVFEQPSMFKIAFGQDDILKGEIQPGDKIGINGQAYPVMGNGIVGMYDVPAVSEYLIYYPATMQLSDKTLKYTLPENQTYSAGKIDPQASPLYRIEDNESLKEADVKLNTVVGALKISIPENKDFAAVTSIVLNAKSDVLAGEISIDTESGTVIFDGNGSKKLSMGGSINITEGGEAFVALPPLTFTDIIDVTLVSNKGQGTASIDLKGKSIEAGKVLSASLEDVEWVSITHYYGIANSIIVSPGTSSVTVDCTPYYTTDLNYSYENLPGSSTSLARSAKMLWNDVATNFVGDVALNADQKSFTVSLNGQPGNAVVAIYDTEDPEDEGAVILWSYHIWVTDMNEQVLEVNGKGNGYTVLDRNLGAVSATPGDWRSIGLLYQWGRKDPLIGTCEVGKNTNTTMYDYSGTISLPIVNGSQTNGTVEYATKNPTKFIKYSRSSSNTSSLPYWYAYDWLYYADDALWGNPEGFTYPMAATLQKSVYDPCPEGYMVAPRDVWMKAADGSNKEASVLADAVWDATNKGYMLSEGDGKEWWYPIGGWRGRKDGKLTTADTTGYYWYSTVENSKSANATYMSISSGGVTLNGKNSRANSSSVRCIKVNP